MSMVWVNMFIVMLIVIMPSVVLPTVIAPLTLRQNKLDPLTLAIIFSQVLHLHMSQDKILK
jgi:hypothetical protein